MAGHVTMDLCLSNGNIGRNVLSKGNVVSTTHTRTYVLMLYLIFRGIKTPLRSLFINITILLHLFLYLLFHLPLFFFLRLLLHLHTYLFLSSFTISSIFFSSYNFSISSTLTSTSTFFTYITHHTSNILQMHVPSLYTALRKTTWGGLVPLLQDDMVTTPHPILFFSSLYVNLDFELIFFKYRPL